MKNHKILMVSASLLAIICIIGFGYYVSGINISTKASFSKELNESQEEIINIMYGADYPVTEEITTMTQESDLVVIGTYDSFHSSWNMVRNPNDIKQEDDEHYTEGHLYNFKIKEILVGDSENKNILVNLRYSELIVVEDEESNKYKVEWKDPLFQVPQIGEDYLLFLKRDNNFGNYYGAIEPFQIIINKNGIAQLKTNLKNEYTEVKQQFNPDNSGIIAEIGMELEPLEDRISGKNIKELKGEIDKSKEKE